MTSDFSMDTVDVEDLRQQLSAASIELEEYKEQFKKHFSKNYKDIEAFLQEINEITTDEKKMRVKINQLENDLEYQLKRLDLICKTKGMARPKRPTVLPDKPSRASGSYVSPYRMQKGQSPSPARNLSNSSANRKLGYQGNPLNKYTPPNVRKTSLTKSRDTSPAGSVGSQKKPERSASLRNRSPGLANDSMNRSPGISSTGNRLYSPSGNMRGGSPTAYAAHQAGANRVRREPAVAGAIAAT